jgi:cobalt/nickel transport system permease protein
MMIFHRGPRTFLHRVDPRARLLAALAFGLLVAVAGQFPALVAALAVAVLTAAPARVLNRSTFWRLMHVNSFVLLLVILLPLSTPGEPAVRLGLLTWSGDGLLRAAAIGLKANAILLVFTGLVGTMEPAHLGFALGRLRVPTKLTHLFLFMVRYIEVIHREYHRLRNAMRLRGFRPRCDRHTLQSLGYLVGLLLVRAFDRADRIVEAMKCRGFRGRFYVLATFRPGPGDVAFCAAAMAVVLLVGWLEWA